MPFTPTGNPAVDAVGAAMDQANTVEASAIAFINGVPGMISAAVAQAEANGATAAQLAPVSALGTTLAATSAALQQALTANTPVAPAGSAAPPATK